MVHDSFKALKLIKVKQHRINTLNFMDFLLHKFCIDKKTLI